MRARANVPDMEQRKSFRLPVIDIAPLLGAGAGERARVAEEIGAAYRETGFFYAVGHAISSATLRALDETSRSFFAPPGSREDADRDGEGRAGRSRGRRGLRWRGTGRRRLGRSRRGC